MSQASSQSATQTPELPMPIKSKSVMHAIGGGKGMSAGDRNKLKQCVEDIEHIQESQKRIAHKLQEINLDEFRKKLYHIEESMDKFAYKQETDDRALDNMNQILQA